MTNTDCYMRIYKGVMYFFHKFYCSFFISSRHIELEGILFEKSTNKTKSKYISKCMELLVAKMVIFNLWEVSLPSNTIFKFKISACGNPSVTNKRKPAVINFTQEITKVKNLWS